MRKLVLVAALMLGGCSNLGQTLNTVGTDLGIIAATLPTACANLSATLVSTAQSGVVTGKLQQALNTATAKYTKYCPTTGTVVSDSATIIAAIQQVIADIQTAKAAQ